MKVLIVSSALVLLCLTHVTKATDDLDGVTDDGDVDLEFGDDEVSVAVREELEKQVEDRDISCSCGGGSCSCCADITLESLDVDEDVCVEVSRSGWRVTIAVKLSGTTLFSKTIHPGQSLPGPCLRFGLGKLCLKFSNVKFSPLRGCANLKLMLGWYTVGTYKLGCFSV